MSEFEFHHLLEEKLRREYSKRLGQIAKGVVPELYLRGVGYLEGINDALVMCDQTANQLTGSPQEEEKQGKGYDS